LLKVALNTINPNPLLLAWYMITLTNCDRSIHLYGTSIHTKSSNSSCKIYVFLSIYAGNSQLLIKTLNLPSPTEFLLDLSIWVKQWVSYKLHELLTIREHSGSALLFGGSVLLIFLVFCDVEVGFTTTCAISAYHHWSCDVKSCSWRGAFDITEVLLKVALNTINPNPLLLAWYMITGTDWRCNYGGWGRRWMGRY
jgi:hypothetical protein